MAGLEVNHAEPHYIVIELTDRIYIPLSQRSVDTRYYQSRGLDSYRILVIAQLTLLLRAADFIIRLI